MLHVQKRTRIALRKGNPHARNTEFRDGEYTVIRDFCTRSKSSLHLFISCLFLMCPLFGSLPHFYFQVLAAANDLGLDSPRISI